MRREEVIEKVSQISKDKWRRNILVKTKEKIKWLPITRLEIKGVGYGVEFGISEIGCWVFEREDVLIDIHCRHPLYLLYHFLEYSLQEVKTIISNRFLSMDLPEDLINSFPFHHIVMSALACNRHWGVTALNWLDEGLFISFEIAESLNQFVQNKYYSQSSRQLALKFLRHWETSHNFVFLRYSK